jgi:trehalose synthase
MAIQEVRLSARRLQQFAQIVPPGEMGEALQSAAAVRDRLEGRVLWQVNSTAVGGGVAEMLPPLLGYTRGTGVDARWVVIDGDPEFFRITKRIHHALHGSLGDGTPLDDQARRHYEETLRKNAEELCAVVRSGDVVFLHDPQTAGLGPALVRAGARVLWRCHIGHDTTNEEVEAGWRWLRPYLESIPLFVFSRQAYIPDYCDHGKSAIVTPSIDVFSPKNQDLDDATVRSILVQADLVGGPAPEERPPLFWCDDGSPERVCRQAEVVRLGGAPSWETPLVLQVSRWDPLKDPVGVMRGFVELLQRSGRTDVELILAGPSTEGVADDPEGASVLQEVIAAWRELPESLQARIHLASLPTDDVAENAAIVNALQRHASVIVQKSLHEGFGLTVTEAMWKGRPVVASAVGGIQDQIENGVSGVLLENPEDLSAFADALAGVLNDPQRARRLGEAGRDRVREHFLGVRHLLKYARLIERLDS